MIVGTTGRLTLTCKDYDGVLANPSSLTGRWTAPDGTVISMTFTNAGTGLYTTSQLFSQAGVWKAHAEASGLGVDAVFEEAYSVKRSIL